MSILWNFDKYAKIEELPFDPAYISSSYLTAVSANELLLKAGTPLKATSGVVAPLGQNDTPTCFANEDYHFILTNPQQPKMIKCVTKGYVEQAKVLAAAGLESVPDGLADALAALGLFLVDDLGNLPGGSGGGSSGGGVFDVHLTESSSDKTYAEISSAYESGLLVVFHWADGLTYPVSSLAVYVEGEGDDSAYFFASNVSTAHAADDLAICSSSAYVVSSESGVNNKVYTVAIKSV